MKYLRFLFTNGRMANKVGWMWRLKTFNISASIIFSFITKFLTFSVHLASRVRPRRKSYCIVALTTPKGFESNTLISFNKVQGHLKQLFIRCPWLEWFKSFCYHCAYGFNSDQKEVGSFISEIDVFHNWY